MDNETKFIDGLRCFNPSPNAPDFILADLSLEREVLHNWLAQNYKGERYIKANLKRSKDGKLYIAINDWKPQDQAVPTFQQPAPVQPIAEDDVPF